MNIFFTKLVLLVTMASAIIVYEWWSLEQRIQTLGMVRAEIDLPYKVIKLLQAVPNAQVIIAGDSKSERGLNPRVFIDKGIPAINVALPSKDLWTLVRTMETTNLDKHPGIFLISIGSYQINDGNIDKGNYNAEQFFSYTPWERLKMFKSSYFLAARTMLAAEDSYFAYDSVIRQIPGAPGFYKDLGFLAIEPGEHACGKIRHNSRATYMSVYKNIEANGARWRLFHEALKKLDSWPGRYFLFSAPHSAKSRACMKGSFAEDFEIEFTNKVIQATKDSKRIRFVDFIFNPPITIDDRLFYDGGHIDRNGAEVFTQWWVSYLQKERLL